MAFKINYTGANTGINYTYRCNDCEKDVEVRHSASSDEPVLCADCLAPMHKVILTAPSLDGDHHQSMMSWNIGWDE